MKVNKETSRQKEHEVARLKQELVNAKRDNDHEAQVELESKLRRLDQ